MNNLTGSSVGRATHLPIPLHVGAAAATGFTLRLDQSSLTSRDKPGFPTPKGTPMSIKSTDAPAPRRLDWHSE